MKKFRKAMSLKVENVFSNKEKTERNAEIGFRQLTIEIKGYTENESNKIFDAFIDKTIDLDVEIAGCPYIDEKEDGIVEYGDYITCPEENIDVLKILFKNFKKVENIKKILTSEDTETTETIDIEIEKTSKKYTALALNKEYQVYTTIESDLPKYEFVKELRRNGYSVNYNNVKLTEVYNALRESNIDKKDRIKINTMKQFEDFTKPKIPEWQRKREGHQYTYRSRGYSPGCQPNNAIHVFDKDGYKFEVIVYENPLTKEQINNYELFYIGEYRDEKYI